MNSRQKFEVQDVSAFCRNKQPENRIEVVEKFEVVEKWLNADLKGGLK